MATDNLDLAKALAPEDTIFEINEEAGDPLVNPSTPPAIPDLGTPAGEDTVEILEEAPVASTEPAFEIEEEIPPSALDNLANTSVDMVGDSLSDKSLEEGGLAAPSIDEQLDDLDDVEIVDESAGQLDYANPGQLVAAILDKARTFTKYAKTSPNSIRRATALCDHLEKMIIAGVTADAVEQKLSLAQLKLLDDVEAGILATKAFFSRERTVTAKARFVDENLQYDPFCSTVARILVNAQVQGGKKIQEVFASLKDKYAIDKREALMISQIMNDMGYPVRSLIDGEDMIEQFYA